jgi:hypothetical protein
MCAEKSEGAMEALALGGLTETGLLLAHRVISLRSGIWPLSRHSGLWQTVRPGDYGFAA